MSTFKEQDHPRAKTGEFTTKTNSAPTAVLTDDLCSRCDEASVEQGLCERHLESARWGDTGIREGSRTPWGAADHVDHVVPGITIVSTPGHGGYKLSPERNALIPRALRTGSGWYEEDCEANIVGRYFPAEIVAQPHLRDRYAEEQMRDECEQSIKDYFPEQWEAANGATLAPGESRNKDEAEWLKRNADALIVTSASRSESDPDMVVVTARLGGTDKETSEFLVPKDEYDAARKNGAPGQRGRFVVDTARHPRLPDAPNVQVERPPLVKLTPPSTMELAGDTSVTPAAIQRISKDLSQLWRREDGSVASLRDILEKEGVSGKSAMVEGSSLSYSLTQTIPGSTATKVLKVSKATFDYFQNIPDDRSPHRKAQQEAERYQNGLDNRRSSYVAPEEKQRADSLWKKSRELRDAEEAEQIAREGTWQEREAAQKQAQIERERSARIA